MNKCFFSGVLKASPLKVELENNVTLAKSTLLTQSHWHTDAGDKNVSNDYINLVFRGKQADLALANLDLGDVMQVEGSMHTRSYLDSNNRTVYITEINVHSFEVFSKAPPAELDNDNMFAQAQEAIGTPIPTTERMIEFNS